MEGTSQNPITISDTESDIESVAESVQDHNISWSSIESNTLLDISYRAEDLSDFQEPYPPYPIASTSAASASSSSSSASQNMDKYLVTDFSTKEYRLFKTQSSDNYLSQLTNAIDTIPSSEDDSMSLLSYYFKQSSSEKYIYKIEETIVSQNKYLINANISFFYDTVSSKHSKKVLHSHLFIHVMYDNNNITHVYNIIIPVRKTRHASLEEGCSTLAGHTIKWLHLNQKKLTPHTT